MKLNKKVAKYFDRKGTGEITVYDFIIRLLGYISFTLVILATLAWIYYNYLI
ncbi:MAG: hypothetical protein AB3K77_11835 [Methanosarcinaceae archaeon]|uniref:hypothetical protein n=1 Tax=Methanosarcina sp. MTP4 TaxID=1434100 RepID=UPI000AE5790C|nr:hypothetical protein [Methanosarcina sp. MTP4]